MVVQLKPNKNLSRPDLIYPKWGVEGRVGDFHSAAPPLNIEHVVAAN